MQRSTGDYVYVDNQRNCALLIVRNAILIPRIVHTDLFDWLTSKTRCVLVNIATATLIDGFERQRPRACVRPKLTTEMRNPPTYRQRRMPPSPWWKNQNPTPYQIE